MSSQFGTSGVEMCGHRRCVYSARQVIIVNAHRLYNFGPTVNRKKTVYMFTCLSNIVRLYSQLITSTYI